MKKTASGALACAMLMLLSARFGTGFRNDQWHVVGPGGGGAQFFPTISPHHPKHLLVACDMTGSYLTEDGGASWRMFNLGGTTRFFTWDPNDANVIYAGNLGLYRSGDAGKSWRLLLPAASEVSGLDMGDDHADTTILVGGKPSTRVAAFDVAPGDSKTLSGLGEELRVSADGGASWRQNANSKGPSAGSLLRPAFFWRSSDRFGS